MEIRFLKIEEAPRCNDFYNRTRNTNRSMKQWSWDFVPSIYYTETIPYVIIEDAEKIVGIQALIPIRMIDSDGVFWTAKSEDTYLDSDYRGRKLFKGMYDLIFSYAKDNKLAYIWGFTKAEKPLIKIDFAIPCHTSQILFPFSRRCVNSLAPKSEKTSLKEKLKKLTLRNACSAAVVVSSWKLSRTYAKLHKDDAGKDIELRTLAEPPSDAGELCHKFIKQWGGKTIYRDADYMRWRTFENPFLASIFRAVYHLDQLIGWAIFAIDDHRIGQLVDIIVATEGHTQLDPQKVIQLLLADVASTLRNMGATALRGWHVNNHRFDLALLKASKSIGFYHLQRGYAMVIYPSGAAADSKGANDLANWYVSRIATEGTQG